MRNKDKPSPPQKDRRPVRSVAEERSILANEFVKRVDFDKHEKRMKDKGFSYTYEGDTSQHSSRSSAISIYTAVLQLMQLNNDDSYYVPTKDKNKDLLIYDVEQAEGLVKAAVEHRESIRRACREARQNIEGAASYAVAMQHYSAFSSEE